MPAKKTLDMDNRDIRPNSVVRRFMTDNQTATSEQAVQENQQQDIQPQPEEQPQQQPVSQQTQPISVMNEPNQPTASSADLIKEPVVMVEKVETKQAPPRYLFRNAMEDIVYSETSTTVKHIREMCKCPVCISDICAIVLNQVQPYYVTTEAGELIGRAALLNIVQLSKISVEVFRAIEMVKKKPSHPLTECIF